MISLEHPVPYSDSQVIDSFLHKQIEGFLSIPIEQPCLPIQSKKIQAKGKRYRKSCWTLNQNLKYREFLLSNGHLLEASLQNRRESQVNKMLSLHLKTRSPDQCRSHHQKMYARHQSITGIVEYIDQLTQINSIDIKKNNKTASFMTRKLRIRSQKLRKDKVDKWIDCIWYSSIVNGASESQTE